MESLKITGMILDMKDSFCSHINRFYPTELKFCTEKDITSGDPRVIFSLCKISDLQDKSLEMRAKKVLQVTINNLQMTFWRTAYIFRSRRYLNRRGCVCLWFCVSVVLCVFFTKLFENSKNRFRDYLTLRYLPQQVVSELT